ncbi:hypothetical protein D3Z53_15645 [Lachnospiraceae bacterium]|nr:hypothetical protein [uncultured Schaedlerella sp.]MCI9152607.1 hypothetical protein [Ruminococcus sp.]NBI59459.1 hypothetical protein [Lachnospiraceae bacterium]
MKRYNGMEVEVVKLGLCNIEDIGLSSKEVLEQSVVWLREKYETTGDARYLDKAVWHIYAYLEMGYPYESGRAKFQTVLDALGEKEEDVFPKRSWGGKKVPLKKMRINQLLGKWSRGLQSMKISDAVEDIMEKSLNRQIGEYTYHCGKVVKQDGEDTLWENTCKLYVREEEVVFHNVNKGKYYILGE